MFSRTVYGRKSRNNSASIALHCAAWILAFRGGDAVLADVVTANFVNDSLFSYRIDHMPDLDQTRAGLSGDGKRVDGRKGRYLPSILIS